MKRSRSMRLAAIVLPLTLFVTACGGADDDNSSSSGSEEAGELNPDAEIAAGYTSVPTSFDPHQSRIPLFSDPGYLSPVYDQLLTLDADLQITPGLATEWEVSDDGLSMSMTLREGVTFQDGSGFDSEVVKANFNRAATLETSTIKNLVANIASVETDGPTKVTITFKTPSHSFPYTLAEYYGLSSMISGKAIADGADLSRTPAGSGPFTLAELGQDRATYERWDEYWDEEHPALVRRATIIGIPDENARLSALQSGQIQLSHATAFASAAWQPIVDSGQFEATTYPNGGQTFGILFNTNVPGIDNEDLRRAVSLAVDRESLAEAASGGAGEVAYQWFPEGTPGYLPELDEDAYDPDEARQLVAGIANPTVTIVMNSTEPSDTIATIVQAQLTEVGINVETKKYPPTGAGSAFRAGEGGAYAVAAVNGGDPMTYLTYWALGPQNPGGASPELQAAFAELQAIPLDDPSREESLQEINRIITEQSVQIPFFRIQNVWLASPEVVGVEDMTFTRVGASPDLRHIGIER